jgi:hypothetical protein
VASSAGYYLRLAAVAVASEKVGILNQCPRGMMMTIGTLLGQLDVFGMVELK